MGLADEGARGGKPPVQYLIRHSDFCAKIGLNAAPVIYLSVQSLHEAYALSRPFIERELATPSLSANDKTPDHKYDGQGAGSEALGKAIIDVAKGGRTYYLSDARDMYAQRKAGIREEHDIRRDWGLLIERLGEDIPPAKPQAAPCDLL